MLTGVTLVLGLLHTNASRVSLARCCAERDRYKRRYRQAKRDAVDARAAIQRTADAARDRKQTCRRARREVAVARAAIERTANDKKVPCVPLIPVVPAFGSLSGLQDSWGRANCIASDPQCGCAKCESDEEWDISLDA